MKTKEKVEQGKGTTAHLMMPWGYLFQFIYLRMPVEFFSYPFLNNEFRHPIILLKKNKQKKQKTQKHKKNL